MHCDLLQCIFKAFCIIILLYCTPILMKSQDKTLALPKFEVVPTVDACTLMSKKVPHKTSQVKVQIGAIQVEHLDVHFDALTRCHGQLWLSGSPCKIERDDETMLNIWTDSFSGADSQRTKWNANWILISLEGCPLYFEKMEFLFSIWQSRGILYEMLVAWCSLWFITETLDSGVNLIISATQVKVNWKFVNCSLLTHISSHPCL